MLKAVMLFILSSYPMFALAVADRTEPNFTSVPAHLRVKIVSDHVTSCQLTSDPAYRGLPAKIAKVQPADASSTESLAAVYAKPGPSMGGGLSGDILYVFPDSDYIYVEWADIMPATIMSKGKWSVENGYLHLADDASLTGSARLGRVSVDWLPLKLTRDTTQTLCLVGANFQYRYLLEHLYPALDPGHMVLICALEKSQPITLEESQKLKDTLKRYWRPKYVSGQGYDPEEMKW